MKILVIEDEPEIRKSILIFLHNEGLICESAFDYESAIDKITVYEYDCVLLDLNLPGGSGLDLLKILKRNQPRTGIIILSANNKIEDKISGLEIGADDYITKPFHLSELNARIKSVIRRNRQAGMKQIIINELKILPESYELFVNGDAIVITRKEFDLLLFLINNKNRVVTKSSISEHLWGDFMDQADSFDVIYAHIKNLRKKIIEKGGADYIKTVYGIGYNFKTE